MLTDTQDHLPMTQPQQIRRPVTQVCCRCIGNIDRHRSHTCQKFLRASKNNHARDIVIDKLEK